jgi:transmembrane protein EpsG
MVMGILILVSGLRHGIGDTWAYKQLYKTIIMFGQVPRGSYETGYVVFLTLLTQVSSNPQFMIFVNSFITNFLNIGVLRKYSSLFELQTFMYITSGYYLVTMNGVRQALAAAVIFASTRFIIEGKFKTYLLIILLMYTFHTSALIMIPVYFIARQDLWSKKTLLVFLVLPIVFIFFNPLMSIMFQTMEGSRYASYQGAILTGGEGGASIFRVLVAAVPVVMAYLGRHKLREEWAESNVFVNMSLINLIFMIFSLMNWLFARFAFYFQPYNFVLLPYMIKILFNRQEKQFVYLLFIICYLAFFYYEQALTLGIKYTSDFF